MLSQCKGDFTTLHEIGTGIYEKRRAQLSVQRVNKSMVARAMQSNPPRSASAIYAYAYVKWRRTEREDGGGKIQETMGPGSNALPKLQPLSR